MTALHDRHVLKRVDNFKIIFLKFLNARKNYPRITKNRKYTSFEKAIDKFDKWS